MMPNVIIKDTYQTTRKDGQTTFQEPQLKYSGTKAIAVTELFKTNQPSKV